MTLQLPNPAQSRQTRQQFVNPEDYLSYELGKAVRELPPLYTRLLAGGLTAIVLSAIAWAHFSKVDEVAVTQGQLVPSAQVRPVKALEGGVINEILVKEGQTVKKGDVLIRQNPELSQSEVDRLQRSTDLIQQDVNRLEAERTGQTGTGTAFQNQLLAARLREYDTRRASAQSEAQRQQAAMREAQVQLEKLQGNLANARVALTNSEEREASLRGLVDGAIPRFDYLQAKDQLTEAQDRVSSLEKEIAAQRQAIQQAEQAYQGALQAIDRVTAERQSEILSQLNQRREELTSAQGQLKQAKIRTQGDTITAPVSGKIYNLQATMGERTIEPGEELLSILPDGQGLRLEVKVLNRDIGFIREGQRVKVKIATFPFQEFGTINGTVAQISPNATVEQDLGLVYSAKIDLETTTIRVNGSPVELAPGMAATGEIVTRNRSILTFLLEPITRRFDEAFSAR